MEKKYNIRTLTKEDIVGASHSVLEGLGYLLAGETKDAHEAFESIVHGWRYRGNSIVLDLGKCSVTIDVHVNLF